MRKSLVAAAALAMALAGPATSAFADANANGAAIGSPGFLSGNVVQVPIHIQTNVCGNSFSLIGLLNPSFGNVCINA